MSRNDVKRVEFPDVELFYGLFNGQVIGIKNQEIVLKDFLSKKELSFKLDLSLDLDSTASGKQIWINQIGDVGYGNERDLFENFKHFMKGNVKIAPKKYWKARKGERVLMNLLKNTLCLSSFSEETNYAKNKNYIEEIVEGGESGVRALKKLFTTDDGRELSVGGILYISTEFEEKILKSFVPSMKVSMLRNSKGDFSLLSKDFHLKELSNLFNGGYNPPGYYNWGNIKEYIHEIKRRDSSQI